MSDVSRDYYQALLVPNRRTGPGSLWAAQSSFDEQNPRPKPAEPVGNYSGNIIPGGAPSAAIDVRCQHAGMPGFRNDGSTGRLLYGASLLVKKSTEAATGWLGADTPGAIADVEQTVWSASGNGDYERPSVVTLADGTIVQAVDANGDIKVSTRDPDTEAWSSWVTVHDNATDDLDAKYATVKLFGDHLYLFHWVEVPHASTATSVGATVRVHRSTDSGTTWTCVQEAATTDGDVYMVLPAASGTGSSKYRVGRFDVAWLRGELVLVSEIRLNDNAGQVDMLRQWSSSDLGMSLTQNVASFVLSAGSVARPTMAVHNDAVVIGFLSSSVGAAFGKLGSAWQGIDALDYSATASNWADVINGGFGTVTGTASGCLDGDLTMCRDPAGLLWVFGRRPNPVIGSVPTDAGVCTAAYSLNGTSWRDANFSDPGALVGGITTYDGQWYGAQDGGGAATALDCYPRELCATWQRGRAVILGNAQRTGGSGNDEETYAFYLGGLTNLTMPRCGDAVLLSDRSYWLWNYLPLVPADSWSGITTTTAGTSSSALVTPGYHRVTTGNGAGGTGQRYHTWAGVAANGDYSVACEGETRPLANGSVTADNIVMSPRLAKAGAGIEVRARFDDTQIRFIDPVGPTTLATVTGLTAGVLYKVRMVLYGNEGMSVRYCRLWYRESDTDEERRWIYVGKYNLADDGGAGGVVCQLDWGHLAASGSVTQTQSTWRGVKYAEGERYSGADPIGSVEAWYDHNPATKNPRHITGRLVGLEPVYAGSGHFVTAQDGPFQRADQWAIPATGEFPIEAALSLTQPSPRYGYRSRATVAPATTPAQQQIALSLDPVLLDTQNSDHGTPYKALILRGCNWRLGTLKRRDAGVAWNTQAAIDMATGLSGLSYARTGNVLTPGSTDAPYFTKHELAGWTAEYGSSPVIRRVDTNDEGRFSNAGVEAEGRITLSGVAAADPTSAGTLNLWSPDLVLVFPRNQCAGWMLEINAQATVDDDIRIGSMHVCDVHLLAAPLSWGHVIELQPGHEREELYNGQDHLYTPKPPRRMVEFSFTDGQIDESPIFGASTPNTVAASATGGTTPDGSPSATAREVEGLMRHLAGWPCGLVLDFVKGPPDTVHYLRRSQQVFGVMDGVVRGEHHLGDMARASVRRLAPIRLVEVT